MADAVRVGLVGLGTVGTGLVRMLDEGRARIAERLGFPLELVRIATRAPERDRGLSLSTRTRSRSPSLTLSVETCRVTTTW